jgi:hypothetical protein
MPAQVVAASQMAVHGRDPGTSQSLLPPRSATTEPLPQEYHAIQIKYKLSALTLQAVRSALPHPPLNLLLQRASTATEFRCHVIKPHERAFFHDLNKPMSNAHCGIRWPVGESTPTQPWHKVFLLAQLTLAHGDWPHKLKAKARVDLLSEKGRIMKVLLLILRAAVEVACVAEDGAAVLAALALTRAVASSVWDEPGTQLYQISGIGRVKVEKLVLAGVRTIHQLAAKEFFDIERLVSRNPPFGQDLVNRLEHFPRLTLDVGLIGRQVTVADHALHPPTVVRARLGYSNVRRPPVWNDKVPWVVFVVERHDGRLEFCWRGSMKVLAETDSGKELVFSVNLAGKAAKVSLCCEEIAGTLIQGTLST